MIAPYVMMSTWPWFSESYHIPVFTHSTCCDHILGKSRSGLMDIMVISLKMFERSTENMNAWWHLIQICCMFHIICVNLFVFWTQTPSKKPCVFLFSGSHPSSVSGFWLPPCRFLRGAKTFRGHLEIVKSCLFKSSCVFLANASWNSLDSLDMMKTCLEFINRIYLKAVHYSGFTSSPYGKNTVMNSYVSWDMMSHFHVGAARQLHPWDAYDVLPKF